MSIDDRILEIEKRLKIIEDRHDDRVNAMYEADEAMEEASELEHGQY